jgi:DNA mismatch repair protein MutL
VSSNIVKATVNLDNYKIPGIAESTEALKVTESFEMQEVSTKIEGLKTSGNADIAKAPEISVADEDAKTPETIKEQSSQEVEYFKSGSLNTKQQIDKAPVFEGFIPIGQLFSTYIIFEKESEIILVDQHAAHERLKYEELMQRYYKKEINSQYLLSPVVIELTYQELKFIEEEKNFFENLGFTYEDFGNNSIIIRSVPVNDIELDVKDVFLSIIDTAINSIKAGYEKAADEIIYSMACKSAVKANKKLDLREMHELLNSLGKLSNPYTCPHGRPTVLYLKRYELEKMFKRIV